MYWMTRINEGDRNKSEKPPERVAATNRAACDKVQTSPPLCLFSLATLTPPQLR